MVDEASFDEVVATIVAGKGGEVRGLLARLSANPAHAHSVLDELSGSGDPLLRFWAATAIRDTIGRQGTDILLRLFHDRASEVRDEALKSLLKVDKEAARSLGPSLRQRLRSKEIFGPIPAMWAIAEMGDIDAVPALEEVVRTAERPFHRNTAAVVLMLLRNDETGILSRIRAHEHNMIPVLAIGARMLGTAEAVRVLEECAASAPDAECQHDCEQQLLELQGVDTSEIWTDEA